MFIHNLARYRTPQCLGLFSKGPTLYACVFVRANITNVKMIKTLNFIIAINKHESV